jgi:hypothetical protein
VQAGGERAHRRLEPEHWIDDVVENLLLRHQLGVLTRPTRTRPRARLRAWDKLVWVVARRLRTSWRQLIEARPWDSKPRHLLRDRDAVYGHDFRQCARRIGVDAIATHIRSPRANAAVERVSGTLRRECLNHMIVLDEHHLSSVLHEFMTYYNRDRPHRTLGLQTPEPRPHPTTGPIRSRPIVNGRQHVYERVA